MGKWRKLYTFKLPEGASFPLFSAPPEEPGKFLRMIKIELGPEYEFTLLSPAFVGLWTHFIDKRTMPCFKEATGACEFCGPGTSRRWYAYAAVYSHRAKSKGIVTIPKGAFGNDPVLRGAKGDLTGKRLRAWRTGGHIRGRVVCRLDLLSDRPVSEEDRVERPDLLAQLFWIWGVRTQEEGQNGRA